MVSYVALAMVSTKLSVMAKIEPPILFVKIYYANN